MPAPETTRVVLAPWVVARTASEQEGHGHYLLGPSLVLLHLSARDLDALEVEAPTRALLDAEGFLAPSEPVRPCPPPRSSKTGLTNARCIVANGVDEAQRLAEALADLDPDLPWSVHASVPEPAQDGARGMLLWLSHREPLMGADEILPLLEHWTVIWCGEGTDGPHVGPRLETAEQVRDHRRASFEWSGIEALRKLGFAELPSTIARWIHRDPFAVARAVLEIATRPAGPCIRLGDGSLVVPWTSMVVGAPISADELLQTQRWSRGVLRDLEIERAECPRVYFGSCITPCGADPFLEGNFGKGTTEDEARATTVGEAVERFGAYLGSLRALPVVEPGELRCHRLEDFHPFGPGYDEYLRRERPPLPLTPVFDEVSRSMVAVPRVLVPVPYLPAPGEWVPTGSSSSGLAAYTHRDGAVLRGALEVLERDNLYRALVQLSAGERLHPLRVPPSGRHAELVGLAAELERLGLRTWLVRYPGIDGVPIVHAFLWEASITTMSRGTGSGTTWATAGLKALLEALQLRLQHRLVREQGAETDVDPGYVAWSRPDVGARLIAYLDELPAASSELSEPRDEAELLQHLRSSLPTMLVADLPCPVREWSVVHVLIPGATCVCIASDSAGGRPLLAPRFEHPIPI